MQHIRTISAILLAACFSTAAKAQKTFTFRSSGAETAHAVAKKPRPIQHETSFGLRLNSDGWSGYVDLGSIRSSEEKSRDKFYNVRLFQVELSEHKNPKEGKALDLRAGIRRRYR